jgi:glycosyltransferase involved in cell wall biosynthesis
MSGGGAERLHLGLAPLWAERGIDLRLLLDRRAGALLDLVPPQIRVDSLGAERQLDAIPRLVRYLRDDPPDVLIANMEHMAVIAIVARCIARAPTRIIITQHNSLAQQFNRRSWQWRVLPPLFRWALARADGIVAVSAGVADEMAEITGVSRTRMTVIHNGVVGPEFLAAARLPTANPLASNGEEPLVLGMGRLVAQKDFATLIRAFAELAADSPGRLVILGEGPLRSDLEQLATELGVADQVALPGFAADAPAWLARADLFVLSSAFEGFGNVIAEALAVGTPVVSTDCPHGPSEILEGGRHGRLVPPGDAPAMAAAMRATLAAPGDAAARIVRGFSFDLPTCAEQYATLVSKCMGVVI